jgi:hypothetical protein
MHTYIYDLILDYFFPHIHLYIRHKSIFFHTVQVLCEMYKYVQIVIHVHLYNIYLIIYSRPATIYILHFNLCLSIYKHN